MSLSEYEWVRIERNLAYGESELENKSMNELFVAVIESLEPSFQKLVAMPPVTAATLPASMPTAGIYLFSENGIPLYVGRTRNLRGRIGRHSRPGATYKMAAFAFHIAREVTGNLEATYRKIGGRSSLIEIPEFYLAFTQAKQRIRAMDLRYVEERDPVRQAILEIYVSLCLKTPYNDFDTH
jgi:hypothetical protein